MFAYEQTAFGSLALPALPKIRSGDARDLCVVCFGAEHAQSALEGAGCVHSVNVLNGDTYKLLPNVSQWVLQTAGSGIGTGSKQSPEEGGPPHAERLYIRYFIVPKKDGCTP